MWSILDDEGATAADAVPGLRSALSDSSAPKNEELTVCWICAGLLTREENERGYTSCLTDALLLLRNLLQTIDMDRGTSDKVMSEIS